MSFPTTHWSRLAIATLHGQAEAKAALEELCRVYWRPVKAYIRGRGFADNAAEDLTQEFMLHIMESSLFRRADRLRGQFRSFLLGALVRFLRDSGERRNAQKRGGTVPHLSAEFCEANGGPEPLAVAAPGAALFDREWALALLETSLARARKEFIQSGRESAFEVLKGFLPGGSADCSYETAAQKLGITVPAFKSEVHRLRLKFREVIRSEIARTVSAPHEVEMEIAHLGQILMDKGTDLNGTLKPFAAIA